MLLGSQVIDVLKGTRDEGDRQRKRLAPQRQSSAGIFRSREWRSGWILEIATAGTVWWMKRGTYKESSQSARLRKGCRSSSARCPAVGSHLKPGPIRRG